jgi:hypothetical protein
MQDTPDSCEQCAYWKELTEASDKVRSGICRRYPAQMMCDSDGDPMCAQPIAESDDWCGEFAQVLQS